MKGSPDKIINEISQEITERVKEVYRDSVWSDEETLPSDDPHIKEFLEISSKKKFFQGRIGYCFQPLIKHIEEKLEDRLAFVILMYSHGLLSPNVPMKQLKFCAFNNWNRRLESQLRFRKIFRFIGTDRFSQFSIQTSKILFEKTGWKPQGEADCRPYIYSFEQGSLRTGPEGIQIVPVGPLLERVLDSFYFQNLNNYLTGAPPESIWDELGKQFKRFYEDGDLEKYVMARRETAEQDKTSASYAFIKHIDNNSLVAFEQLLGTFGLRSSKDLRRRFLNYLTWMLLCDEKIKSYSYIGALNKDLPQGELVIGSREHADIDLVVRAKTIAMKGFRQIFHSQRQIDRSTKTFDGFGTTRRRKSDNDVQDNEQPAERSDPATLDEERIAVHEYINDINRIGSDQSAKLKAVSGLDNALLNYVGPIVTDTFLSPHKHLSLDPFWSENIKEGGDAFRRYIADLTHSALREEFSLYERNVAAFQRAMNGKLLYKSKQSSRVNPFLMAMSPIADYLAQEMKIIREAVIDDSDHLTLTNRSLGETPLDSSGLLSLNIVFWDIATTRFRYCSLSFINSDQVFDYAFSKFFRLIETTNVADSSQNQAAGRGILKNVLLMSDVLFRTSRGRIEPVCIVFQDPQTFVERSNFFSLPVGEYIEYLKAEKTGAHEAFNKLYLDILLEDDIGKQQKLFEDFCSNERAPHGVWDFLRNGGEKAKTLIERAKTFLERYGIECDTLDTVAHFLAYITWLWLCYRERVAYYYYIPAQLPFNERIGGFAIASETPFAADILDFLFVSIVPRIVAHPALLHHREAVTQLSRTIQQCWFDSLLHLIRNSYGIEAIDQDLEAVDLGLKEVQRSIGPPHKSKIEELQKLITDAQEQMDKIPGLEADLKRMFDEQSSLDSRLMKPSGVFTLSFRLSSKFAQKRDIALNLTKANAGSEELIENFNVHSPIVLVLWHLILNACEAVDKLPKEAERRVTVSSKIDAENQQLIVFVKNLALRSTVEGLEQRDDWSGLQKDNAVLQVLWHGTLAGIVPEEPLSVRVRPCDDPQLVEVEVSINAPAIPISSI